MLLFPESGPKKELSGNGFTKTVTPHLRSIVPNVQRRMAYFAVAAQQVVAAEHSGVSLLCTWSILYMVMETLEDGTHCGRLLEEI